MHACTQTYVECLLGCEYDNFCISECSRDEIKCQDHCPCYTNCSSGCPCDYDSSWCPETTTTTTTAEPPSTTMPTSTSTTTTTTTTTTPWDYFGQILIVNPSYNSNDEENKSQMIYTFSFDEYQGITDKREYIDLEIAELFQEDRDFSCAYTLKGNMYMIGGRGAQSSKLYQLTSSAITELPILPFQFEGPLCQSYNDKDVYACASVSDERRCWQIRGTGGYHYISHLMLDSHSFGSLIQYNEELLVMGGNDNIRGSTERFIFEGETWESLSTDDHLKNLHSFTTVQLDEILYLFGGAIGADSDLYSRRILTMNDDYMWNKFYLQMRRPRVGHSSIKIDEITVAHIFGAKSNTIEIWRFEEFIRTEESRLNEDDWAFYPGLFLLD